MKILNIVIRFLLISQISLLSVQISWAQKLPDCIKTAKSNRPTEMMVESGKLSRFYQNYGEKVSFGRMKMVKVELTYYLLSEDRNSPCIFAFELEQKGKKLYLNKTLPIHICEQGDLSLDTYLQDDEKIIGCKLGPHTIKTFQNN